MNSINADERCGTPRPPSGRPRPRHGGSILMAAMIGLAEVLDMGRAPTEMVQPADADDDSGLDLNFGALPPLD